MSKSRRVLAKSDSGSGKRDFTTDNLLRWMSPHLETCGLVAYDFPDTGRGLRATVPIAAGSRLLRCAAPRCFTAAVVSAHPVFRGAGELHKTAPLDCLVLFLMYEDSIGASSPYAPYIASLPRTFTNPLYPFLLRDHDETSFGSGDSDVEDLLRAQHEEYYKSWKNISAVTASEVGSLRGIFNKERFMWAWFVVATRSLYINQQQPALVPFVDLLNHSPHAQVRIEWNARGQTFEIFTDTAYKAGDQVFINYGAHDNNKLAVYYGFVCLDNPLVEVKLDWDCSLAVCPGLSEDKIKFLKSYGAYEPLACSYTGFTFTSNLFLWTAFYDGQNYWSQLDKAEKMPTSERCKNAVLKLLRDELSLTKYRHYDNYSYRTNTPSLFRLLADGKASILRANIDRLTSQDNYYDDGYCCDDGGGSPRDYDYMDTY